MTLEVLNPLAALDAMAPANVGSILKELQGLRIAVVNGAGANTKMDIAAMRTEDTIVSAMRMLDTWAAPTEDLANITIQSTKAGAVFTISAGGPTNGETFIIGPDTYTFKTTGTATAATHVNLGVSNSVTLDNMVAVVNAYQNKRESGGWRTPAVVLSKTDATHVAITAFDDGIGNVVTVTENTSGTTIVAATSGTASATLTLVSAVNTDAIVLQGVTFTIKTSPTSGSLVEVGVKASDTLQATAIANMINHYDMFQGGLDVTASSSLGVVTLVPRSYKKGNAVNCSDSATGLATSAAALTGGTATGGIKSTTDNALATLFVVWLDKR